MMQIQSVLPHTGGKGRSEDLDLIEVLWRQDIDLGVGKEMFDAKLRRELERDRELELQKKREKQKEIELLRQKAEEERRQQEQQWLTQNFMRDGETGEWVPLNNSEALPPQHLSTDILNSTQLLDGALSLEEALEILNAETGTFDPSVDLQPPVNNTPLPVAPVHHSPPPQVAGNFNQTQSQQPPPNINRQESFDQNWDDLVNLLDLAGMNGTLMNMTDMNSTQLNATNMNTPQMNMSNLSNAQMNAANMSTPPMNMNTVNTSCAMTSPPVQTPCSIDNGVLLQNATLPAPVANVTMSSPVHTTANITSTGHNDFLALTQDFNSSVPTADSMGPLDWDASDMLFNITSVNQTESAEDIEGLLPDFLPEDELDMAINEGLQTMQMLDEASSDSAVSMGSASPMQDLNDSSSMSPFDGLEGATGGSDYGSPSYSRASKYDPEEYHYGYSSCSRSQSDSSQTNYSTSSNETDVNKTPGGGGSNHIHHNHTYPLKPGASPKEVKTYTKTEKQKTKGPHMRDQKRAMELNLPFTVDQIIESPVEEFNEMITKYKLTEPQIQLIRDIRRRGKNKVAAQNCRKRKLDVVVTLEDEMKELQDAKDQLIRERQIIDKQTREMKEKFTHMYQEIFRSLRDEHGRPYDPNEFSLQQSSDGNVFLVPRNYSTSEQQMKANKKRKNDKK